MNTKQKFLASFAIAGFAFASAAHADDIDRQQTKYDTSPGYVDPSSSNTPDYHYDGKYMGPNQPDQQEQKSVARDNTDYHSGSIRDEVLGFTPQIGSLSYTNANGAYSARAIAGITGSFNLTPLVADANNRDWYVGITSGTLYSHSGSSSSNFFGSNSNVVSSDDSNILIIPADLKIGYNIGESFRISAHGGGEVTYRSVANTVNWGPGSSSGDSLWRFFPNAGADLEWQVSKRVSILVRPDMLLTPGSDSLTATVGATFVAL